MTYELSQGQLRALVEAHGSYPANYDEVFTEIQDRIRSSGHVGKSDIGALMFWKRLNLQTPWAAKLNNMPDAEVKRITAAAIEQGNEGEIPAAAGRARSVLKQLPGCGATAQAVPSTILAAAFPERMAVYDRRALKSLVTLGFPRVELGYQSYIGQLCALTEQLEKFTGESWFPRDVDNALFRFSE